MIANRLQATVAGACGYHSGMSESERKKAFNEASELIRRIDNNEIGSTMHGLVATTMQAISGFDEMKTQIEKEMKKIALTLPIVPWVQHPDQKGFGIHMCAIIIGETGDLSNYEAPGKLWARMGCAPYEKDGEMHMAKTWRSRANKKGVVKLHASDWEEYGYSPRRRSIAYLVGEGLLKLNGDGPYRTRYNEAKARFAELHPETSKGHCHYHGMLLAAKLLLKNLWIEWNR